MPEATKRYFRSAAFAILLAIPVASTARATEPPVMEATAAASMAFARYLAGLEASPWNLETVEIDASLPKLQKHGRLRAIRRLLPFGKPEYQVLEITRFQPWTALDGATVAKTLTFGLSFFLGDIDNTIALQTYAAVFGPATGFALFSEDLWRSQPFYLASTVPDASAATLAPAESSSVASSMMSATEPPASPSWAFWPVCHPRPSIQVDRRVMKRR